MAVAFPYSRIREVLMPVDAVLQTWKEISEYVGRTERTVRRWEQQFGFPVHRPSGRSRSSVMALTQEIREWTRGKPSLVEIRQSTRLSGAKLFRLTGHDHDFRNRPIRGSSHELPASIPPDFVSGNKLANIALERLRRSELLLQTQKNLQLHIENLLREQRTLCEKLKRNRQRRLPAG